MAETTKRVRRRAKDRAEQTQDSASDVTNGAGGREEDSDDERSSSSSGTATITSELKDAFREAAIEVLRPVMRKATTAAAKYAVTQGPSLVKDKVAPKVADAGGAANIAKGVASKGGGIAETVGGVASGIGSKLPGGKKEGKSPSGTGRGRRLPVEEWIDVGVDLETAYNQFTQFEDWPEFMHRVERIEQRDDTTLMWHENIWGVRRSWEAEITEQTPCERLVWRSKNGPQTLGVVTFHRLSDNLTRIMITMDFQPKGLFEKTSSGTRISRRALKSDLMRFKAFIELRDDATGSWDGRIEDGEVVDETEDDEEQDEQPRASDEEDEDFVEDEDEDEDEEEEPEASEDEDFVDEEYEEDEEEEDDEEPRGSGNGRFSRESDEPEDEESEEAPKPRRRRKPAARSKG
jgi:uncharacterized membrane protein